MRPFSEMYPAYVDGVGWVDDGARDDGYCPVCNTKNLVKWEEEVSRRRDARLAEERIRLAEEEHAKKIAEDDKARVASTVETLVILPNL